MLFKISKLKINLSRTAAFFVIALLGYFSVIGQSMAGGGSSQQTYTLIDALHEELIKRKVCDNASMCSEMLQTLSEGQKRIYLNMYGQTDTVFASHVVAFFIEKGIKITEGTPISLRVFPKPKTEYLGLKYAFGSNDYLIKLDINKE